MPPIEPGVWPNTRGRILLACGLVAAAATGWLLSSPASSILAWAGVGLLWALIGLYWLVWVIFCAQLRKTPRGVLGIPIIVVVLLVVAAFKLPFMARWQFDEKPFQEVVDKVATGTPIDSWNGQQVGTHAITKVTTERGVIMFDFGNCFSCRSAGIAWTAPGTPHPNTLKFTHPTTFTPLTGNWWEYTEKGE